MTTKDYVYLGLILLTALAFYCNGFYAGVCRSKRVYETLLDDSEIPAGTETPTPTEGKIIVTSGKEFSTALSSRASVPAAPTLEPRSNFSRN